jgi:hypothetical protein
VSEGVERRGWEARGRGGLRIGQSQPIVDADHGFMSQGERTRLVRLVAASGTASRGGSSAAKHKEKKFLSLPGRGGV